MIQQPSNMTFENKKFSMIIYGSPGLGKTTLALSAPNPILIDFDRGISRVKAYHRQLTITCSNYEEVLKDIESDEVKACETIIIDTGGSFVTYLQDWAMRSNTANRQKNGAISLKGFGVVKAEFERFTNYIRDALNKNVVYVFHSDEQKDTDGKVTQRLQCEGAARNMVWKPCDFGGYMQMQGDKRTITFTPSPEFFAKGCYGIEGPKDIPEIGPEIKNDFLTKLFEKAKKNIADENEALAPLKEKYNAAMNEAHKIVDEIKTVDDANAAIVSLPAIEHALTSKVEAKALLSAKANELGLEWDGKAKTHKKKEA